MPDEWKHESSASNKQYVASCLAFSYWYFVLGNDWQLFAQWNFGPDCCQGKYILSCLTLKMIERYYWSSVCDLKIHFETTTQTLGVDIIESRDYFESVRIFFPALESLEF